jgi:uncharacterized membrane protein YeaQ/YmgE (transglycosylase-associated protein family)
MGAAVVSRPCREISILAVCLAQTVGQLEGDWIWESSDMSIIWTIIIGFAAGIVAKFLHPGSSNEPSGFILTAALGIVGAFLATYLGQAIGWYRAGEAAGFIGAVVGAIIVLVVWGFLAPKLQKNT